MSERVQCAARDLRNASDNVSLTAALTKFGGTPYYIAPEVRYWHLLTMLSPLTSAALPKPHPGEIHPHSSHQAGGDVSGVKDGTVCVCHARATSLILALRLSSANTLLLLVLH